MNELPMKT